MLQAKASSRQVRDHISHPIIDTDGHVLEMLPAVFPFLRESLGARRFDEYMKQMPASRRRSQTASAWAAIRCLLRQTGTMTQSGSLTSRSMKVASARRWSILSRGTPA